MFYSQQFHPAQFPNPTYNYAHMDTALAIGVRFVDTLFFIGLIGSSAVVLLSFVEDFSELFSREEEEP